MINNVRIAFTCLPIRLLRIFFVLLLTHAAETSLAQDAPAISGVTGTLTDYSGKPMDYASVSLIRVSDSAIVKGTLTNEFGIYNLGNIIPGNYVVVATSVGYDKVISAPFSISDSQIALSVPPIAMHSGTNTLGTVVVTSSVPLIERKADMTIVNVANSVLATGNNALEILARAPGVTLDQDDNISLSEKKGVTVMINDKLTYLSPAQLATLLKSTDGTTIQSIEINTNPSARYDASGSSGIINIKLKKNKQSGTNGSFTTGIGYSNSWKDNETISLNHKSGNLNLYGSFSHNDARYDNNILINRVVGNSSGNKNYFKQSSSSPITIHNNSYRIGADYDITTNNTVGVILNGYANTGHENIASLTNIGNSPNEVNSYLNTLSQINTSYNNFALDLSDKIMLDTTGQSLAIDLDYSKFTNGQNSQHNTSYFNPDGSILMPPEYLRQQSPSAIIIHTAKADYTYPFSKSLKLETGIKFSDVKTDNNLAAQQQVNGFYQNDSTLTNHFTYTEKISACYINLTKSLKKTDVEIGLRGEYTSSIGDLLTYNDMVTRSYFNLFPSLFINRVINDKNEAGFAYVRRIDRPDYDNLNPFVYYIDQYTYAKGNPFLNPQFANSFEFSYSYNRRINASFNYSHTSDLMTTVLLTDPASEATYQTSINLQSKNAYTLNINAPLTISKWWVVNADVNVFYFMFKSDSLLGEKFNRGKVAYQVKLSQTFKLTKSLKAEVMSSYASSLDDGIFQISSRYSNDAGVSYSFAHNRANVKLSMNDIFNTLKDHVVSNYQINDIDLREKRDTRITRLTFTYNFGSDKIRQHTHRTGLDDLSGRVKGSN